jgi:hypothetical protein
MGPARRAAEIAAAGDHSLLLVGPREAGQAVLARRVPSILPPLERSEALDVLRIASAMGTAAVATGRPFRSVPPTTGITSMLGYGSPLSPGEVTLVHHGVLFLERLTELDLETLRGIVTSRCSSRDHRASFNSASAWTGARGSQPPRWVDSHAPPGCGVQRDATPIAPAA